MSKLNALSLIVGLILGVAALAGGTWAAWELRQEVANNTDWRLLQTFERLSLIRKKRPLTQIEWLTWCKAGVDLGVFAVCPSR